MTTENGQSPMPTREQIARRAYEIFLSRGGAPGHDTDDWLQAEYELMRLPIREIAKLDAPKSSQKKSPKKSIVALVHAAVYSGVGSLTHLMR